MVIMLKIARLVIIKLLPSPDNVHVCLARRMTLQHRERDDNDHFPFKIFHNERGNGKGSDMPRVCRRQNGNASMAST